jgi:hypothetical protein
MLAGAIEERLPAQTNTSICFTVKVTPDYAAE